MSTVLRGVTGSRIRPRSDILARLGARRIRRASAGVILCPSRRGAMRPQFAHSFRGARTQRGAPASRLRRDAEATTLIDASSNSSSSVPRTALHATSCHHSSQWETSAEYVSARLPAAVYAARCRRGRRLRRASATCSRDRCHLRYLHRKRDRRRRRSRRRRNSSSGEAHFARPWARRKRPSALPGRGLSARLRDRACAAFRCETRTRNLASAHAARGATPEERVEPCRRAVLGATAVAPEELRGPETALRQRLVRLDTSTTSRTTSPRSPGRPSTR